MDSSASCASLSDPCGRFYHPLGNYFLDFNCIQIYKNLVEGFGLRGLGFGSLGL